VTVMWKRAPWREMTQIQLAARVGIADE